MSQTYITMLNKHSQFVNRIRSRFNLRLDKLGSYFVVSISEENDPVVLELNRVTCPKIAIAQYNKILNKYLATTWQSVAYSTTDDAKITTLEYSGVLDFIS